MPRAKAQKDIKDLTYELALQELETAIRRLESGELALEDSMALFERGQALVAHCSRLLDQAELRLKTLAPDETGRQQEVDLAGLPEDEEE